MADNTRSRSKSDKTTSGVTEMQTIPLHIVKELLSVQESNMKSFFVAYMNSTNSKIDNLIKVVQDLKTSLEYTQAQVEDLKKINCKERLQNFQNNVCSLFDKVDDIENRSRRNNLRYEGIDEETEYRSESWQKSEEKVTQILKDKMNLPVDEIKIERAHRVGARRPGKARAIVVKFLNYKYRERVFKQRRSLKGTRVFVREDYTDRMAEKRKELIPEMLEARKNGKVAYIRYNKFIIHDRPTMAYGRLAYPQRQSPSSTSYSEAVN